MSFTRAGIWQQPTGLEIKAFQDALLSKETESKKNVEVKPTPELINAISHSIEKASNPGPSTADFFKTIAKLKGPVDIVVPVYGGLHVLKPCVNSILSRTNWAYRLIFVDDASPDPYVHDYLNEVASKHDNVTVIFNKKNRGFAATVNRGINAGNNPYVCILNSDVIVTDNWLVKLLMAIESNEKNVIVNPVTNNTAMVNVDTYPGENYLSMNYALERQSSVKYPEAMPTGFCYLIYRDLFDKIGPFDEAYGSYGEESDFWFKSLRDTADGILLHQRAVLADNCYIFHERGTSFSQLGEGEHFKQRRSGSARFNNLHPTFGEWVKGYSVDGAVGGLRKNIPKDAFTRKTKGNIAWAVKSTAPCGGMWYISDIANRLIEDGYNVKICLIPDEPDAVQGLIGGLHTRPVTFASKEEFVDRFPTDVFKEGILISAVSELTPPCHKLARKHTNIRAYNHIQSWDVDLAKDVGREELIPDILTAYKSLPNIISSKWIENEIKKIGGDIVGTHYPGVNTDLFHPRSQSNRDERFTVGVMMMTSYVFKGYDRGVKYCQALWEEAKKRSLRKTGWGEKDEIRILAIGVESVPECPYVVGVGALTPSAFAQYLGIELDVLVDPSYRHSYGLPAIEALMSGANALCWENKGVREYASCFKNNLKIMPDEDMERAAKATLDFSFAPNKVPKTPKNFAHRREDSVANFIKDMYPLNQKIKPLNIEVITPHMRKHGGPTTNAALAEQLDNIGHNVNMNMIYTDFNPEVLNSVTVPIRTEWETLPSDTDCIIINSDNPFAAQTMEKNPDAKYIMYKLSHNARFQKNEEDNLNLNWDRIITSTAWLREVCIKQQEGWTHKEWDSSKVNVVGWYHYGHKIFNYPPQNRTYGDAEAGFRVGTLIHDHALKGSRAALAIIEGLKKKYEANFHAVGIGECKAKLPWHMQYIRSPHRSDLAHVMSQLDIWLGASHTEGLGRMSLEAMSSGLVVITTDTGAEFLKHGENCLLYKIGDAQKAAELIDQVVNDRELFTQLVLNGYETASGAANPDMFKQNIHKVVTEVCNERH